MNHYCGMCATRVMQTKVQGDPQGKMNGLRTVKRARLAWLPLLRAFGEELGAPLALLSAITPHLMPVQMNEQCMTGEDLHSLYLLLHLPDALVHVARGGSHVLSAWHWLRGLPSRVYPSLHSKVTLSLYRNSWLLSDSFQIPFVNSGRLHFTSEIRKIRRELIFCW